MTAGRFFVAVWLVKGNGTRTTSPSSKGIVGIVVGIAPDPGEGGRARRCGGAGKGALLLAQPDEVDEVLHLGDPLGRQRLNLLDQGIGLDGQGSVSSGGRMHSPRYG